MMDRERIGLIAATLLLIVVSILMGPADIFTHGFFSNKIDCGQIAENDWQGDIDLADREYEMVFSPKDRHMAGFEIYLANQPEGNKGRLNMEISDASGKQIESISVDLEKVHEAAWYAVYIKSKLKEGKSYTLKFSAEDCDRISHLKRVNEDYLPDETVEGNILLSYAYAQPTFTFQNKIIIFIFLVAAWLCVCSIFINKKAETVCRLAAVICFMTAVLSWNYMYNSMDNQNSCFAGFQADSETLVTGMIYAEEDGVSFKNSDERGFGMGRYYDLKGGLYGYGTDYITDDNWLDGYSRGESALVVNSNIYSKEIAVTGNYIAFENGEQYRITNVEDNGTSIVIYLDAGKVLTPAKYGSLDDAQFYDSNHQPLEKSMIVAYKSQFGLNGKIFRSMARHMEDEREIATLNLLCSISTAVVFVLITIVLFKKYNVLLAGCFFAVFWLSPWVVNFAKNLYWVEFTWFVPVLAGLFCAWKAENRDCRIVSYIAAFFSIFIKCLCGYEYISVIMMGMISFLLVDLVISIIDMDMEKGKLLFRTVIIMGLIALAGFMFAICVHAKLKGDGNIIEGVKVIFEQDVLKRTAGADLNKFDESYWAALNASIWETYSKYFHFETEVVLGIDGNLFPALCIVPLCIFGYDYKKGKLNIEQIAMYFVFFLTSVSWFCLAKAHSYIHTHMNYVLWYFGFVQICIYIIVSRIVNVFKQKSREGEM